MQVARPGVYPTRRNLKVARRQAAVGSITTIVERAEDHVPHPAAIPVETVTGSVKRIMVGAYHSRTGANHILARGVAKKDLANRRKGISSVPVAGRLPILAGRLARAAVAARLCDIDAIAGIIDQLIAIHGPAHSIFCPVADDGGGVRIYCVFTDHVRLS